MNDLWAKLAGPERVDYNRKIPGLSGPSSDRERRSYHAIYGARIFGQPIIFLRMNIIIVLSESRAIKQIHHLFICG